jgi:hypothetical protein
MPRTLAELLTEIAQKALESNEAVLAHLCRMAALEANRSNLVLRWEWKTPAYRPADGDDVSPHPTPRNGPATAKPYQVWAKKGTGSYSVLAPNAKAALAAMELLSRDHLDVAIKDMDGNSVDSRVLQVMVDLEENPTIRLVPR